MQENSDVTFRVGSLAGRGGVGVGVLGAGVRHGHHHRRFTSCQFRES